MKDNKQLLDKDGNVITKEYIDKVLKETMGEMKPLLEKCEWEEGGHLCHTWKINSPVGPGKRAVSVYTNDAGAAQIQKAMEEWVNKEYGR